MTGQLRALLCIVALWVSHTSNEESVRVEISEALPTEVAFILSSWKHSALDAPQNSPYKGSGMVRSLFTKYNADVRDVFDTKPLLLVAREQTDPSFLYGWICAGVYGDELAIIYMYTKYKFRRLEIASSLKDAVLDRAPDDLAPVYCHRSVHDRMFERWGFEFQPLHDVIGGQVNGLGTRVGA